MGAGILLDLLLIGIVLFFAFRSARHGFVRTVIELVGWLAVFYLAMQLAPSLSSVIYKTFVYPALNARITESVHASVAATATETSQALWVNLPGFLTNTAALGGISKTLVSDTVAASLSGGADAVTAQMMTHVVEPIMLSLIRWILVALLFTVGMFLVRLLARCLNRVFSYRGVGAVNRLLGGVLGALKGCLFAVLLCLLLTLVASIVTDSNSFFTADFLSTSFFYQLMMGFTVTL